MEIKINHKMTVMIVLTFRHYFSKLLMYVKARSYVVRGDLPNWIPLCISVIIYYRETQLAIFIYVSG